ncbi:MAG: hypothetical protein ACRBEE_06825 [Arenicella sp.]
MAVKSLFSAVAIFLTLIAFVPYIRSILLGSTKPHVFSWVIWGITTGIVFFAQLEAGGGVGAWPIGVSGVFTLIIAMLAVLKRADIQITRSDYWFMVAALASLPVWYLTANPLWAVVVLTIVDLLGFGPTLRKAYDFPYEENLLFFMLFMVRNLCAIFALESYSVTTVMFPLSIALTCGILVAVIYMRRKLLSKEF